MKHDDCEKSPYASLPCIPHHGGVPAGTPRSPGFGRPASGAFCKAVNKKRFSKTFYEFIKNQKNHREV